ncbi:1406_t:CDS:1, partial [Acaulospora colombiana]
GQPPKTGSEERKFTERVFCPGKSRSARRTISLVLAARSGPARRETPRPGHGGGRELIKKKRNVGELHPRKWDLRYQRIN